MLHMDMVIVAVDAEVIGQAINRYPLLNRTDLEKTFAKNQVVDRVYDFRKVNIHFQHTHCDQPVELHIHSTKALKVLFDKNANHQVFVQNPANLDMDIQKQLQPLLLQLLPDHPPVQVHKDLIEL